MGVKIKATRKISPKDKDKIKRNISNNYSATVDKNKIASSTGRKSVKNNKKHK